MQGLLVRAVIFYRLFFSAWVGASCRFEPSCSSYALQALNTHGAAAGTYLTLKRLGRCHPWCDGGFDPVQAERPRFFTRWLNSPTEKNSL